jgi:hypothetical protein
MRRLRKQKKLLKRREKEMFELGRADAEELERLEQLEQLNEAIASTNPEAPAEAAIVDWSEIWEFGGIGTELVGNS